MRGLRGDEGPTRRRGAYAATGDLRGDGEPARGWWRARARATWITGRFQPLRSTLTSISDGNVDRGRVIRRRATFPPHERANFRPVVPQAPPAHTSAPTPPPPAPPVWAAQPPSRPAADPMAPMGRGDPSMSCFTVLGFAVGGGKEAGGWARRWWSAIAVVNARNSGRRRARRPSPEVNVSAREVPFRRAGQPPGTTGHGRRRRRLRPRRPTRCGAPSRPTPEMNAHQPLGDSQHDDRGIAHHPPGVSRLALGSRTSAVPTTAPSSRSRSASNDPPGSTMRESTTDSDPAAHATFPPTRPSPAMDNSSRA